MIVNNTNADIREFDAVILAAANNGGSMPEELSDIFTLTLADNGNWILDWA